MAVLASRILNKTFTASEAVGVVGQQLKLVFHGKMEFPEHFKFRPDLSGSWLCIKLMLDCARLEHFYAVSVKLHEHQAGFLVHGLHPLIDLLDDLIPVLELRARHPLGNLWLRRVRGDKQGTTFRCKV